MSTVPMNPPAENRRTLAAALDEQGGALASLEDIVHGLRDRLEPILRPSTPTPDPGLALPRENLHQSEVSARVDTATANITQARHRLGDLLARIDL